MGYKEIVGIYCIENMINGKKYIGLSKNIKRRVNAHFSYSNVTNKRYKNNKLYNAIRKYGKDNFKWYILEECETSELEEKEIYYILKYNTTNNDFGYNNESGGKANIIVSEETKDKLKNAQKTNKRVVKLDRYGNFISEYISMSEASRSIGDKRRVRDIAKSCNNSFYTCKNFVFCYSEDYYSGNFELNKESFIVQLDTYGNYINEFYNAVEASKSVNIRPSIITNILNKRCKNLFHLGFTWVYYSDYKTNS